MSEELQKYDASVVMQGVKDKIKATFVSLIPDDKWDEMIQNEIDNWLKTDDSWSNKKDSEFKKLIDECIREILKEKVSSLLKEKYVSNIWENGELKPSKEIEKIVVENSGKIMLSVIGGMVQQTINNIQYR